ncbi:MAG: GNAT family N-acetyltransferase [Beijerinckiaceae bacterium]
MLELNIRLARHSEIETLQQIEIDATPALVEAGAFPAGEPRPMSIGIFAAVISEELCLVVEVPPAGIVGFVAAVVITDDLYVAELDVLRSHHRQGIGRRLMAAIIEEGVRRKLQRAVLTTDRHAPFNRPFYEKLGFQVMEPPVPPLDGLLAEEIRQGMDPARRVGMVKQLGER